MTKKSIHYLMLGVFVLVVGCAKQQVESLRGVSLCVKPYPGELKSQALRRLMMMNAKPGFAVVNGHELLHVENETDNLSERTRGYAVSELTPPEQAIKIIELENNLCVQNQ